MLGPILAALAFFVLFVLVYRHFRGFYPSSEFQELNPAVVSPDTPRLIFFYALWCPHSRKALTEWKSFQELVRGKTYGGKTLEFESVDGESAPTKLARYGVEAFPTVVLETSDQIIVYDHRVSAKNLRTWLIQTLGQEA